MIETFEESMYKEYRLDRYSSFAVFVNPFNEMEIWRESITSSYLISLNDKTYAFCPKETKFFLSLCDPYPRNSTNRSDRVLGLKLLNL